jgi:ribosomal-protein-alanine N-acetyltransferase
LTDITIRPFAPDDLLDVIQVEKNVYGSAAYLPLFLRQLYDLFPGLIHIAETDQFVIGHICGAIAGDGKTGWILNVAVVARYRRQGVARRLFQTVIRALWEVGVERIKITAEDDNRAVIKLYESLGFQPIGTEANYYGDGRDRVIFERTP